MDAIESLDIHLSTEEIEKSEEAYVPHPDNLSFYKQQATLLKKVSSANQ